MTLTTNRIPAPAWSRPYYGLQHAMVGRRQLTICEVAPGVVDATVFPIPGTTDRFWSDAQTTTCTSINAAKAWCLSRVGDL